MKIFEEILLYLLPFSNELMAVQLILMHRYLKRSFFRVRAIAVVGVYFIVFSLCPGEEFLLNHLYLGWFNIYFLIVFLISLPVLFFLFRVEWKSILFNAIAAFSLQHIAGNFSNAVRAFGPWQRASLIGLLIELVFFVVICLPLAVWFSKRFQNEFSELYDGGTLLISAGLFIIVLVTSQIMVNITTIDISGLMLIYLYEDVCCILSLLLQFKLLEQRKMRQERVVLENLLAWQAKQHTFSKEGIELINIKFHDLRKQLNAVRTIEDREMREKRLAEIEASVSQYGNVAVTENETLNILLIEKNFVCAQRGINIVCMVEGHLLAFMTPSDLYALFGNALDNAIECVSEEEAERREIELEVRKKKQFLWIRISNYNSATVTLKDGLPVTTKGDERFHGYGMKSIRFVVEKYGGVMTVNTANKRFTLNILIPMPGEEKEKNDS